MYAMNGFLVNSLAWELSRSSLVKGAQAGVPVLPKAGARCDFLWMRKGVGAALGENAVDSVT